MSWKAKLAVLAVVALPAFSGYLLHLVPGEILAGVQNAWVYYFIVTQAVIFCVAGPRIHGVTLSIAALIALPVVFFGATISYLLFLAGWGDSGGQAAFSAHYVTLCLTMLTVVPLALNMVAAIPFPRIEQALLRSPTGVSKIQKMALMFLRVFNHIVFFVIPNTIEVVREERRLHPDSFFKAPGQRSVKGRAAGLIRDLTQIGVEGICASIQYIPIWAVEISRLPGKERRPS